jgi:DNA-binding transcriptional LysR family regulator
MNLEHVARTDLNLLVVLDDLLRSRSTTLTARRLGRTQSAVSHALRRLRGVFEDPLFVRAGSTLRPTAAAERMRAPLAEVLSQAEGLLSRAGIGFDPSRLERTFTIVGTDYSDILVMPRLMPVIRRTAPGVDVVTRPLGDDVERAIQTRDIDLAFGTGFRSLPGVTSQGVRDDELVVLLRRGHPVLKQRLTPQRYAALDHVLVSPRGQPGGLVDDALESLSLTRRVVLRMPYFAAAAVVVAKTDLVVTLPAAFVSRLAKGLGLVSLKVPFPLRGFTFSMSYSATLEDDPAHRWFRELVIASGRES